MFIARTTCVTIVYELTNICTTLLFCQIHIYAGGDFRGSYFLPRSINRLFEKVSNFKYFRVNANEKAKRIRSQCGEN